MGMKARAKTTRVLPSLARANWRHETRSFAISLFVVMTHLPASNVDEELAPKVTSPSKTIDYLDGRRPPPAGRPLGSASKGEPELGQAHGDLAEGGDDLGRRLEQEECARIRDRRPGC